MAEGFVVCSIAGNGLPGHNDGNRVTCRMNCPSGIALDNGDGIWVSDRQNHCVRRLPGLNEKTDAGREDDITTIAGRPKRSGFKDGRGRDAFFNEPAGLCFTHDGKMLVADRENHAIREIAPDGTVRKIAGGGGGRHQGEYGWGDGPSQVALFNRPFGIAASQSGMIYVADTKNNSVPPQPAAAPAPHRTNARRSRAGRKPGDSSIALDTRVRRAPSEPPLALPADPPDQP